MLYELAEKVAVRLERANMVLALAESCTGGLVSHSLTRIQGVSSVFAGGVIAYSNEFKNASLNVSAEMIEQYGAVSAPVAKAMAENLRVKANVDIVGAVSGIAGPTGGTPEKPVGTVHIAVAVRDKLYHRHLSLKGNRRSIQEQSAKQLLLLIKETIDNL